MDFLCSGNRFKIGCNHIGILKLKSIEWLFITSILTFKVKDNFDRSRLGVIVLVGFGGGNGESKVARSDDKRGRSEI